MSLVDDKKLSLDEKITPYLKPELLTDDIRMNDITVRQLLCHTAGFSPSFELGVDQKLYSNPGETFRYSGVGYIYLQSVIEAISGMTLEQAAKHYVFEPLGMRSSTFERAETITPYMKLSSAVLYALTVFVLSFITLLLISFIIGKITKYRFYSLRSTMLVCIALASGINTIFLLFIFVSKVAILFFLYLILIACSLLLTRKKSVLFYAGTPILTLLIFILSFTLPINIPVSNDLIARDANCAYTLKSSSADMAVFCRELMLQYNNGTEEMKDMFAPAITIDDTNSWGLGLAIESDADGETHWHSGINPGFQSLLVLYPQQDKYVVVLTNSDNGLAFSRDIVRNFLHLEGTWDIKR